MLGEMLGIKTTDSAELIDKLKQFSAKELVDAGKEISKHGVRFLTDFFFFQHVRHVSISQGLDGRNEKV